MPGKINTNKPLVSIIIPCYNYGKYLAETINSVLDQSYSHWECIIVDDGSTDNTREVSAQFCKQDGRFNYFYQANAGLSAARNTGLYNASGQYIQFLDADDKIEAEKLRSQVAYFLDHSQVDILYGDVTYFSGENRPMTQSLNGDNKAWMPQLSGKGRKELKRLIRNNIMAVNCALVKRHLFNSVGYFDEQLKALEDWDFWIRCAVENCYFQYYEGPE